MKAAAYREVNRKFVGPLTQRLPKSNDADEVVV